MWKHNCDDDGDDDDDNDDNGGGCSHVDYGGVVAICFSFRIDSDWLSDTDGQLHSVPQWQMASRYAQLHVGAD